MDALATESGAIAFHRLGEGEPVTLLHGFSQDHSTLLELAGSLPTGFAGLLPDLRGHGRTSLTPPHTMAAAVADVELLWDRLGIERGHLGGYSMGGRVALAFAARHPERVASLFTIGAHAGLEPEQRPARIAADAALAAEIERRGIDWFASYWERLPIFAGLQTLGRERREHLRRVRLANSPRALAESLRGMGAGAMEPVWDRLGRVGAPALFLAGELDLRFAAQARRLAARVPNGRAVLVPEAGHAAHLERPREVAMLLAGHLQAANEPRPKSRE